MLRSYNKKSFTTPVVWMSTSTKIKRGTCKGNLYIFELNVSWSKVVETEAEELSEVCHILNTSSLQTTKLLQKKAQKPIFNTKHVTQHSQGDRLMHYTGLLRDDVTLQQKPDAITRFWKFQETTCKLKKQTSKPWK